MAHRVSSRQSAPRTSASNGYCRLVTRQPAITIGFSPHRRAAGNTAGRTTNRPPMISASDASTSGGVTPARNR